MNGTGMPAAAQANQGVVHQWVGWGIAIALSILLNLFLFGIMPGTIQGIPDKPDDSELLNAIPVVRVKRPETPPKKKELVEPEKKPEKIVKAKRPLHVSNPKPVVQKPKLPFELNTKLPPTATSLDMPPLEHFSLNAPGLKGQYNADELDSPLTPLAQVPPVYPHRATRRGIEGWVTVQFVVTKTGTVEDIKIVEAEPETIFNQSVINCLKQWKFKPGTVEGVPVPALARTTIRFQLD